MTSHSIILSDQHIEYKLRQSRRSKYLRLTISPEKGLVVSSPMRVSLKVIEKFIRDRQDWVIKHVNVCSDIQKKVKTEREKLPETVVFPVLDEEWKIEYLHDQNANKYGFEVKGEEKVLSVFGQFESNEAQLLLRQWLMDRAKHSLQAKLAIYAEEYGYRYNRVTIRNQKTRWGSCSSRGNINLNCKLLFLNAEQVRYVLIHELCHLKEANHSSRFWHLVEQAVPDYRELRGQLKQQWLAIPAWAHNL